MPMKFVKTETKFYVTYENVVRHNLLRNLSVKVKERGFQNSWFLNAWKINGDNVSY